MPFKHTHHLNSVPIPSPAKLCWWARARRAHRFFAHPVRSYLGEAYRPLKFAFFFAGALFLLLAVFI